MIEYARVWKRMGIASTFLVGSVVGALALVLGPGDFTYSISVDELVSDQEGHTIHVHGRLEPGSIRFRDQPCTWRFVLMGDEQQVNVEYENCVVPHTFRDTFEIEVAVQGHRRSDGVFEADRIIPRCPSKYDMSHQCQEEMPHQAPI